MTINRIQQVASDIVKQMGYVPLPSIYSQATASSTVASVHKLLVEKCIISYKDDLWWSSLRYQDMAMSLHGYKETSRKLMKSRRICNDSENSLMVSNGIRWTLSKLLNYCFAVMIQTDWEQFQTYLPTFVLLRNTQFKQKRVLAVLKHHKSATCQPCLLPLQLRTEIPNMDWKYDVPIKVWGWCQIGWVLPNSCNSNRDPNHFFFGTKQSTKKESTKKHDLDHDFLYEEQLSKQS